MIIPADAMAMTTRAGWPLRSTLPALAPFPSVPSVGRSHVGAMTAAWNLQGLTGDGQEVVSELATNAVQASIGPDGNPRYLPGGKMPLVLLRLYSDGLRLLVEVHDQAMGKPVLLDAPRDAESGRGLMIVKALAAEWGYHPVPHGKCVWAVLRAA